MRNILIGCALVAGMFVGMPLHASAQSIGLEIGRDGLRLNDGYQDGYYRDGYYRDGYDTAMIAAACGRFVPKAARWARPNAWAFAVPASRMSADGRSKSEAATAPATASMSPSAAHRVARC